MKNKTRMTGFLFCLALFSAALRAEGFRLTTFVDYYGGIESADGYENLRVRYFARPWFSGDNDDLTFKWVLSANLWVQPLGEDLFVDPWNIPEEVYVSFALANLDVSIGQKIVAYGFSDVFGPLNVLHSANRTPLSLDDGYDARRSDPLLQVQLYLGDDGALELTYVPVTRPDRERPDDVYLPETKDTVVWNDDPFILDNPHSVYVNFNRYAEKADYQFFYGWYTEQTPDFKVDTVDRDSASRITTVYNKKQTFGAAWSARAGDSTVSQDIAFNLTKDWDGRDIGGQNSDITVNTQVLYNLPGGILSQYSLVYAYFFNHGEHAPGTDPEAADYLAEEIQGFHTQPLRHIAFIVAHFEKSFFREKLKAQLNTAFFFSPEIYLAPRLGYNMSDNWTFDTGADIMLGNPPDALLRRNPSNDNFYLRLMYRY